MIGNTPHRCNQPSKAGLSANSVPGFVKAPRSAQETRLGADSNAFAQVHFHVKIVNSALRKGKRNRPRSVSNLEYSPRVSHRFLRSGRERRDYCSNVPLAHSFRYAPTGGKLTLTGIQRILNGARRWHLWPSPT